ncbi:MAG: sugar phosphate nucleotidyltransferase [Acidobacteriota bacterium]
MWGIVPAAGRGSRIQPLAFSKELLPAGIERPRAVAEHLIDRMMLGGATKICFVIAPGKSDILEYFGGAIGGASVCYTVQPKPTGLCDAVFRALPVIDRAQPVIVGLPDTIWYPEDALGELPDDMFSFLLFPVERPELFDAVVTSPGGRVREIQVKTPGAASNWIWGAFKMPGRVFAELEALWRERGMADEYIGTLVNAWLGRGGQAAGVRAGTSYMDVGTFEGYREALNLLGGERAAAGKASRV